MTSQLSTFGVAIVGCGTVGGAVASILTRDQAILASRIVPRLQLRHVIDLNLATAHKLGLDPALLGSDVSVALADPQTHAIVELIGGTTVARKIIEQAIRAGKHVVTANKALMAHHGVELLALARQHGVTISFEASTGGGIPIIRALYDGLIANRIDAIYGIVNGTCNYILTCMTQQGKSYAQALSEAQQAGLAEADPTLDVAGLDSAHKLAILASLAFGTQVDFNAIPVEGIDSLELCDVQYGQELGYIVKLLAIAHRQGQGICLRVRPAFISQQHPLAWVSGPFNAISVYGHATGHTMYYGRGAGGMPTASAVVADLASVAMGTAQATFNQVAIWPDRAAAANMLPIDVVESRYYLRLLAEDRPGVFAQIATILSRHDISISSVLQHEHGNGNATVPVIITTHKAVEGNVRTAMAQIDQLDAIRAKTVCLGIVEEHLETF